FPDSASGFDSRLFDEPPIFGVISTVDATSSQVYHGVGPIDFRCPIPDRLGIPADHPPRSVPGIATQDHHLMAVGLEGPRQQRPDLPASSRNNNLHVSSPRIMCILE